MSKRLALHALVALAVSTSATGCFSTVGAVVGNLTANNMNNARTASPDTRHTHHNVTGWTVAGLCLGLVADVLIVRALVNGEAGGGPGLLPDT